MRRANQLAFPSTWSHFLNFHLRIARAQSKSRRQMLSLTRKESWPGFDRACVRGGARLLAIAYLLNLLGGLDIKGQVAAQESAFPPPSALPLQPGLPDPLV